MSEDNLSEKNLYEIKLPEIPKSKILLSKSDSEMTKPSNDIDKPKKIINEDKNLSQLVFVAEEKKEVKVQETLKNDQHTTIVSSPNEILIQNENSKIEPRVVFSEKNSLHDDALLKSNEIKPKNNPSVIIKPKLKPKPIPEKSNTDWNLLNKKEFYPKIIKFFSKNVGGSRSQPSMPSFNSYTSPAQQTQQTQQTQYYNQQQQSPVDYNRMNSPPVSDSFVQRFLKSPANMEQKVLQQDNNQQYGLERTFKQPTMPMQSYNNEQYVYKQRLQILRRNVLPSLGYFALKTVVALSLVYATTELGVWGASSKSKDLWNQIINSYNTRIYNVQPQRPVTIFDLYDGATTQYNEIIKSTITGVQIMTAVTIKSIDYILSM